MAWKNIESELSDKLLSVLKKVNIVRMPQHGDILLTE